MGRPVGIASETVNIANRFQGLRTGETKEDQLCRGVDEIMVDEKDVERLKENWVKKRKRILWMNLIRVSVIFIQAGVSLASVFFFDTTGSIIVILLALGFSEACNLFIGWRIHVVIRKSLRESEKALNEIESQQISVIGGTRGDGHPYRVGHI